MSMAVGQRLRIGDRLLAFVEGRNAAQSGRRNQVPAWCHGSVALARAFRAGYRVGLSPQEPCDASPATAP